MVDAWSWLMASYGRRAFGSGQCLCAVKSPVALGYGSACDFCLALLRIGCMAAVSQELGIFSFGREFGALLCFSAFFLAVLWTRRPP
jgi:hypothetical protein